jgi:hypothetical protein
MIMLSRARLLRGQIAIARALLRPLSHIKKIFKCAVKGAFADTKQAAAKVTK